ncbi:uracil-DNA glycosylase [Nocardia thailandica]
MGIRKQATRVGAAARTRVANWAARARAGLGAGRRPEGERLRDQPGASPGHPATAATVAETTVTDPAAPAPVADTEPTQAPQAADPGIAGVPADPEPGGLVAGRMREPEYRLRQSALVYADHVAPINRLVDDLRAEHGEWMPYVAPTYGGVRARVLAVFRDPGPGSRQDTGSGFVSLENDDQAAERHLDFVSASGVTPADLMVWHTYPWTIGRNPTVAEIDRGLDPLNRLIGLLPDLEVIIVHGVATQNAWKRFEREYPQTAARFTVTKTYHTGKQALWTPDADERDRRLAHIADAYDRAAQAIGVVRAG